MSARPAEGAPANVDRWLSQLGAPAVVPERNPVPGLPGSRMGSEYRCPYCDAARTSSSQERDRYDEDYDYYWGDIRMPLWVALILQVPWRQRLDIFVIGFVLGVVVAGLGLLWGLVLSRY